MKVETHLVNEIRIAEVISEKVLVNDSEQGLQLLVDLYYQDFGCIALHDKNLNPLFFELRNGLLGELLQKFSNFRVRLAIIGTFDKYPGKSLQDFIYESNNGKLVNFVPTQREALSRLSKP